MAAINEMLNIWLSDPIAWSRGVVGIGKQKIDSNERPVELDDWQIESFRDFARMCEAQFKRAQYVGTKHKLSKELLEVVDKIGLATQSGKGCGKTALAALKILWFQMNFTLAKIVILGPKFDQIQKNLFPEITKWIGHSKEVYGEGSLFNDFIEVLSTKIYCKHVPKEKIGLEWITYILSYPKTNSIADQKGNLAGVHADNLLLVVDEASAVPNHVYDALVGTLTGKKGPQVMLAMFNPNKPDGWAIETQKMPDLWMWKHVNCLASNQVSEKSIAAKKRQYGVNSNQYRVDVLGLPPLNKGDGLFPWSWLIEAQDRHEDYKVNDSLPMIFGVDIGLSSDRSVICKRTGGYIHGFEEKDNKDTNVIIQWISDHIDIEEPEVVYLDQNGVGEGIFYPLKKKYGASRIKGIKSQERSHKPEKYHRMRDQAFWNLRTEFEKGHIAIPSDNKQFFDELSLLQFKDDGVIKIISKQNAKYKMEMRDRLGYSSPNLSDAASLTCVYPFEKHLRLSQESAGSWQEATYLQQMRTQYSSGRAYMGA